MISEQFLSFICEHCFWILRERSLIQESEKSMTRENGILKRSASEMLPLTAASQKFSDSLAPLAPIQCLAPNVCEIIQQQCPNMIKVWSSLHLHSISYLKPGAAFENTPNSISFELVLRLFWGLSIKDGLIMSETYISDWTNENTFGWYIDICSRVFRVLCLYFVSILYSWVGHLQIAGNRSAHAALSINLSPPFLQRSCRKHWSKTFGHRLHNQHHYHSRSHLVKMKRSSWYVVMLHQVVTVSQWPKTN